MIYKIVKEQTVYTEADVVNDIIPEIRGDTEEERAVYAAFEMSPKERREYEAYEKFVNEINYSINDGWVPQGGVTYSSKGEIIQAMIKS